MESDREWFSVLQIIPATGWKALYFTEEGEVYGQDLACFGLVDRKQEDGGPKRTVIGLIASNAYTPTSDEHDDELMEASFFPWFLGYASPNQDVSSFASQAREAADNRKSHLEHLSAEARKRAKEREDLARKLVPFKPKNDERNR